MTKKITIIGAMLFAAVIFLTSCSGGNTPESVADSFTKAWAKGDFTKMFKYTDEGLISQFESIIENRKKDGEYDNYVNKITKSEWKFTLDGEPKPNNDGEIVIKYLAKAKGEEAYAPSELGVEKDDAGKWKVTYFGAPYYR